MKASEIFQRVISDMKLGPVFGNPGTTELPMLRYVKDYILTLHDSISVGMADGRAQILGSPSIVNLHTLPGLANSMAFIYTAAANHSPVIITAGQQDYRHLVYDPILSGDLTGLASNAVKYRYEIKQASDVEIAMKRAYEIAMTPPRGPVFLSFPMNIVDEDATYTGTHVKKTGYGLVDQNDVKEIAERINSSRNPAVVFGSEIDEFDAFAEAEKFAEKIGCPVYTEPLGSRAGFLTSSPSYAGELMPGTTLINMALMEYDLIIFIGSDITLYPYIPSPLLPGKDLIFIGLNLSRKIGDSYMANPKTFLSEITGLVKRKGNFRRNPDFSFRTRVANEKKNMGINYVAYSIRKTFEHYTLVDESISSSETIRSVFGYERLGYFTAKSGQLGWGLPAALGITMEKKDTILVIGDGSVMYTIQALWTAKRYGIPLKMIVLKNGGYGILKSFATSYYPGLEKADFLSFGLDLEKIIGSFGIETRTADRNLEDLEWLKSGDESKAIVIDVNPEIQKMFL